MGQHIKCQALHCGRPFPKTKAGTRELLKHTETHSSSSFAPCPPRNKASQKPKTRQAARKGWLPGANGDFCCPVDKCPYRSTRKQQVQRHVKTAHPDAARKKQTKNLRVRGAVVSSSAPGSSTSTEGRRFWCDICGKRYEHAKLVVLHKKRQHAPEKTETYSESKKRLGAESRKRKADYDEKMDEIAEIELEQKRIGLMHENIEERAYDLAEAKEERLSQLREETERFRNSDKNPEKALPDFDNIDPEDLTFSGLIERRGPAMIQQAFNVKALKQNFVFTEKAVDLCATQERGRIVVEKVLEHLAEPIKNGPLCFAQMIVDCTSGALDFAISGRFQDSDEFTTDDIMTKVERIMGSDSEFGIADQFTFELLTINRGAAGGPSRIPKQSFVNPEDYFEYTRYCTARFLYFLFIFYFHHPMYVQYRRNAMQGI